MITPSGKPIDLADPTWILNQYRAAEIHGAGAIMRMGKLAESATLRSDLSRHLRDEAVHAWLWTRAIKELHGDIYQVDQPYQARLSAHFGIPTTLTDMLALTLASEKRGLSEYESHMDEMGLPHVIQRTLRGIVKDEHWHVRYITEELQRRCREDRRVREVIDRAEAADLQAVAELERLAAGSAAH